MTVEKVEHAGKLFALILRASWEAEGINFLTSPENPLQLGVFKHPKSTKIKPHAHKDCENTITAVQEVLHIEYGEIEAYFYDEDGILFDHRRLRTGDTILLLTGGHGFDVLQDSKILEVKQGPYSGVEEDKEYL